MQNVVTYLEPKHMLFEGINKIKINIALVEISIHVSWCNVYTNPISCFHIRFSHIQYLKLKFYTIWYLIVENLIRIWHAVLLCHVYTSNLWNRHGYLPVNEWFLVVTVGWGSQLQWLIINIFHALFEVFC